jgi:type VI secretion system protein ImpJ
MENLPVHWAEGMFLRPQHFQAADRFWSELLCTQQRMDHTFNYGLFSLQLNETALQTGEVDVGRAIVRLRDGGLISIGGKLSLDRLPVGPMLAESDAVTVFLGCPRRQPGQQNVATSEQVGAPRRFSVMNEDRFDESAGGDAQPIELLQLNCRLLASPGRVSSPADAAGYDCVPLLRLRRSPTTGQPEVDPDYVPPLLQLRAWPWLDRDIVRPVFDQITARINVLSEQVRHRGLSLSSKDVGDLERVLMLHELNSAVLVLRSLSMIRPGAAVGQPGSTSSGDQVGVHPFVMYTELSRIVGQLSIFLPERVTGEQEVALYDHENLGPLFRQLRTAIELRLNALQDLTYEQAPFLGNGLRMSAQLQPKWLGADWSWFVGVKGPYQVPRERMIRLMTSQEFSWKLGSDLQVEQLFQRNAGGLKFDALLQPPTILPRDENWAYFRVSKDGPAWQAVVKEQTLSMRFQIDVVANRQTLTGSRVVQLKIDEAVRGMEFCLFAVPQAPAQSR